jgi:hypothetical protein
VGLVEEYALDEMSGDFSMGWMEPKSHSSTDLFAWVGSEGNFP